MKNDIQVAPGIVANWEVCSGTPCVIGRRIGTVWLVGRWWQRESIASLAHDYSMTTEQVECAIRYEYDRRRRRKPEFRAERPVRR